MASSSATPAQFRHLLGHFATGVTVATTCGSDGSPQGMTATAVASVSLDPPLVLVCVNHDDPFHHAMNGASGFAINVLANDQQELSRQFAGAAAARFDDVAYRTTARGIPLLLGVVAHVVCQKWESVNAGDHTVFLGRVVDGAAFERHPLLHFRGGYTGIGEGP